MQPRDLTDAELDVPNISARVLLQFARDQQAQHDATVHALRERIAELEEIADRLMERLVPDEETVHPLH